MCFKNLAVSVVEGPVVAVSQEGVLNFTKEGVQEARHSVSDQKARALHAGMRRACAMLYTGNTWERTCALPFEP